MTLFHRTFGNTFIESLEDDVHIDFRYGLARGKIDTYKKDKEVRLSYDIMIGASVVNKNYKDDVHLFLP